jgi:hypothetical protein
MSGQDYYLAMSNIKKKIKDYLSSSDIDVQSLGRALSDFRSAAQESLHRVPENATAILRGLKMTDKAYAEADRVINAAASHGAREGVFSPAALRSSVRAGDRSLRKKSYAKGNALLQDLSDAGVDVLGSNYPDSGTAGRIFAGSLLGGGLGGGIGGGLATGSPIGAGAAIGAGVAALPYVAGGREVAAALLARRPNFTRAISPYPEMAIKAATPGLTNYIENRKSY